MINCRIFTLTAGCVICCAALAHAEMGIPAAQDKAAKAAESNQVTIDVPPLAPVVELKGSLPVSQMDPRVKPEDDKENDKLKQALAYVYEHHPQLFAEREKVKAVDESVALAISDFRPSAIAEYEKGRERKSSGGATWTYGDTVSRGLTVTQPIFSGLDGVAALKSANQRVKAARADLTALEQQLFFNVVVAYSGVAEAQSVLLLNQHNVDVLTKQRDAAQIRFDVGELTRTDVAQAEARLATAKASEQQALGEVAIARASFVRAVGYAADEEIAMPEVPAGLPADMQAAAELARAASPVIDAARHREKAFASDVNIRAGAILPDVSVRGTMNRSEGGFANQYDNDTLTLNVSIPLYQGGGEWARLRAARNDANQARYVTQDTLLAVEQDVASAWQNYTTAASVITATETAAEASGLALEGVRAEQEYGVRTVLDVLDAEQEYMNTKVNLVRAMRNHKIQAYRLLASVGKLTAGELALPIEHYDPKQNYDAVKYQLLGW